MSEIDHYRRLFRYDRWANNEVLHALRATRPGSGLGSPGHEGKPIEVGLKRMAHILGAEWIWLARLSIPTGGIGVWPELTIDECGRQIDVLGTVWEGYLGGLAPGDLEKSIQYTNTKGEPWSSRVEDVLTHVLMHSAYHRGQIALEMRAVGMNPAYTDFIQAVRSGAIE